MRRLRLPSARTGSVLAPNIWSAARAERSKWFALLRNELLKAAAWCIIGGQQHLFSGIAIFSEGAALEFVGDDQPKGADRCCEHSRVMRPGGFSDQPILGFLIKSVMGAVIGRSKHGNSCRRRTASRSSSGPLPAQDLRVSDGLRLVCCTCGVRLSLWGGAMLQRRTGDTQAFSGNIAEPQRRPVILQCAVSRSYQTVGWLIQWCTNSLVSLSLLLSFSPGWQNRFIPASLSGAAADLDQLHLKDKALLRVVDNLRSNATCARLMRRSR